MIDRDDNQDLFRTRSMDVAVLLRYALGAERHVETICESGGRMLFVFSGLDECRVLKNDYYGEASVTVSDLRAVNDERYALVDAVRDLRGRLYRSSVEQVVEEVSE